MKIALRAINRVLGWIGLVLVVWLPDDSEDIPTRFELTTRQIYIRRCLLQKGATLVPKQ